MTFLSRKLSKKVSDQMKRHTRPVQGFSPQGITRKQNTTRALIDEEGQKGLLDYFHEIDEWQGNAACEFTRVHLRLAHVVFLTPLFVGAFNNGLPVFAVRSSSQKHICEPNELSDIDARTVLRKVEDLPKNVNCENDDYFGVSVIEIVLRKQLNGTLYWMPHVHSIFVGLSREDLERALKPRGINSPFAASPQIHISELNCAGEIIEKEEYEDKATPETKREYLNEDGKLLTCREGISDRVLRAEFHQWFSEYDLSEVVRYTNIPSVLVHEMNNIEMGKLCKRFIKICKETPSHVLKQCSC